MLHRLASAEEIKIVEFKLISAVMLK